MSLINTFVLDLDLKTNSYISEPSITSYDTIRFVVNVSDDGLPLDLTNSTSFTLSSTRSDGIVVLKPGTKTGTNQITFDLGSTEILVPGRVGAKVQMYDSAGRVSTLSFSYMVEKDPSSEGYIPSTDDQTLIQEVLGNGPAILVSAQTATTNANNAADNANASVANIQAAEDVRVTSENTRNTNETTRKNNETARVSAESTRVTAETTRVSNETARSTAETSRVTAETTRAANETARGTAEASRVSVESARVTAETTRASNETARVVSENSRVTAETTRASNETARATAESSRVTAETTRVNAENARVTTETTRASNETARATAESARVTAESTRASNESARVTAESTRASNETTRQTNETTRQANETARQASIAAVAHLGAYNSGTAYVVNNSVSYNGSSYRCILPSTGNLPTNATYWVLEAAKGLDGSGAVSTISSTNSDITVGGTASDPTLTVNSGVGANQISKRDLNGNLQNIGHAVTNVSANTTLTAAQSGLINVTTGASNVTVTLPDAATAQVTFIIKKADNGVGQVVINTTSSQTIDGVTTKALIGQYATISLVSSNGNWLIEVPNGQDQIDTLSAQAITTPALTPVNLGNGLQVVTVPKGAPYNVLNIVGRTLVNLLGRDGNCEDVSKWNAFQSTIALDNTNKVYGSNGLKVTISATFTSGVGYTGANALPQFDATKYYLILADVKNGNGGFVSIYVGNNLATTESNRVTDTTKFNLAYKKITGLSSTTNGVNFKVDGVAGQYGYMDGYRVYQITQAEYNSIDSMTAAQIAAKYPYVDDVKPVLAPYVIKYGENLLPTFNEWTTSSTMPTITEPYGSIIKGKPSGSQYGQNVTLPIVGGQTYTFTAPVTIANIGGTISVGAFYNLVPIDVNGNNLAFLDSAPYATTNGTTIFNKTFTMPVNAVSLKVVLGVESLVTGDFTFSNPMLNLGSTAKAFKPRNDDSLFFPNVQLHSSVDGTVYDQLYKDKGKYSIERRFKDLVLDGSLPWTYAADLAGFKTVQLAAASMPIGKNSGQLAFVKYDGKILKPWTTAYDAPDISFLQASDGFIGMSIADTDSGWGETYTPTAQEIQAYFYGWRLFPSDTDGTGTAIYNSGNKKWVPRKADGSIDLARATLVNATPTGFSPSGFTPYKLTYQLATPTFEEITIDAGMSLHEGLNQIEVGQGVVVREKVTPDTHSDGFTRINNSASGRTSSYLRNRASRITEIYKNGKVDSVWTKAITTGNVIVNGTGHAYIPTANSDLTATYEVSYIALDQYLLSSPVQTVNGETASNLKTVVDTLAANQADNEARIAANELLARQIYNVPKQTTANMTLYVDGTNGADNNDGSAGKPFKTIGRAIDSIPQIVNHTVTVNVAAGTYTEFMAIQGFSGKGSILINGSPPSTPSDSHVIDYARVDNCSCFIQVTGFKMSNTTDYYGITVVGSPNVAFNACKVITSSATRYGVYVITGSCLRLSESIISNRTIAIFTEYGSKVWSYNNTGTGNTTGLRATRGSNISKEGTQPTGITQEDVAAGGTITANGVLNPWGDNTAANRTRVNAYRNNTTQTVNAATYTKIIFDAEIDDTSNAHINGSFTAPRGGVYQIDARASLTGISNGTLVHMRAYINSGASRYFTEQFINGTTAVINGAMQLYLNQGDILEIYVYSASGCTIQSGLYTTSLAITQIA